ncbi:MAG: amidohydrolase family protein [Eubacteriales bacterium]
MYKVFDIHTHTYPEAIAERAVENLGRFYDFVPEGKGTYADLSAQAPENNIRGFLLFSVATNPHQVPKVNDCIASLVQKSRAEGYLTVGFAGMHQDYPDFAGEIERAVRLGLRGVKLHPDIQGIDIDDPKLLPLYEIVEGRMPICFHMGDNRPQYRFSEARKLRHVLEMFPRLEVIAAHLGGYRAHEEAIEYLAGHENVWYDTSSSLWYLSPGEAASIIGKLGTDRVMFGTDYPVKNPAAELALFSRLPLTDAQREDILWNNAIRFLHPEEKA